jgi:hypothetical protein
VAAAAVVSGEAGAKTDADGRFVLALAPGRWPLSVTAPGYQPAKVEIVVVEGRRTEVEVLLVLAGTFRETVEVVAPVGAVSDLPARLPVRPAEVVSVAGGGENIFRVLQTLPGVVGTDDFSSRMSVRGGGPDQNLTVMDGVEIHDPYRLFGLTSAFNPETVQEFELTAGAFSARYGDRLSSLLVVTNRAGSSRHALTGSAGVSLTDTNLVLEGRLPRSVGSWIVSGRRTYYDVFAERFTDSDLPSFNDLQGRLSFGLGGGRTLSVFGLRSREATDASFDLPEEAAEGAITTRSRNDLAALGFRTPLGKRGWARTTLSWYEKTDAFEFGGSFRNEQRRSNAPDVSGFDTANLGLTWESTVRDLAARQELGFSIGRSHLVEAGFEVHGLRTDLGFTIEGRRNETESVGSSLQGSLPSALDSSREDVRAGAWLQDSWQALPRLSVEAGVRVDRSGINDRTYLSPRLAATWALGGSTRLRGALGVHRQSPGYEKLVQSDYLLDLSSDGPLGLDSERARHAVLGLERDWSGGLLTRAEVYYKGFDRLILGRPETPEETAARVALYDFPPDLAWSVPTRREVTVYPSNEGSGYAWGFDLYAARRATSAQTRLTGWGSYAFGFAERTSYGRVYPFEYDRRHALSVVLDWRISRRFRFSAVGRLASGFPYTPVLGVVVAAAHDEADTDGDGNVDELVPQRDPSGLLVYEPDQGGIENLESARMPAYARLDARLTYTPGWGRGRVWFYVDAINVFNRTNAASMVSSLEHDPTSDRPRVVTEPGAGLPFVPSFGVHVDFTRPAWAKKIEGPAPTRRRGFAVGVQPLSSQGFGLQAIVALSPRFGLRGTVGLPTTVSFELEVTDTPWDVEMPVGSSSLRFDWAPKAGAFRVTGGLDFPRSPSELRAQPAATYDVGGATYDAADVGTLQGTASLRRVAPYAGVGWGRPVLGRRRFGVGVDLGFAFQGAPEVSLSATGRLASDPAFQQSLARETEDVAEVLQRWRVYPVLSLSLTFRLF